MERMNNPGNVKRLLCLAGLTFFLVGGAAARAADSSSALNVVGAVELAIHKMVDPFITKLKPPPPPPPVIEAVLPRPKVVVPVKPPPEPEKPRVVVPPDITLTGIVYHPTHPMAIVNGEVVEPGQIISSAGGDIKIMKIDKKSVQVFFSGTVFNFFTDQGER